MARDYYEVLESQAGDDIVLIKRRYRQLVRKNHPDIAANREVAHEMMLLINEAWTILSDPSERAKYDRSRAAAAVRESPSAPGGVYQGRAAPPPPAAPVGRTSSRGSTTRTRLLTMVFEAAEMYFFHGNAEGAIESCRRVLKIDPDNAEACALLGDIYAEQGKKTDAVEMYERAVRSQPHNMLYQQKLSALGGPMPAPAPAAPAAPRPPRQHTGPPGKRKPVGLTGRLNNMQGASGSGSGADAYSTSVNAQGAGVRDFEITERSRQRVAAAARSARAASAPEPGPAAKRAESSVSPRTADRRRAGVGIILAALAIGIVGYSTTAAPVSTGTPFDTELLIGVAISAVVVGASLPLMGVVGRCGRVHRGDPDWIGLPYLLLLAVVGAVYYPAAVALFLLVSLLRRSWYRSVFTVMVLSLAWSAILLSNYKPVQMAEITGAFVTWCGRLVFPSMLLGWGLGSPGTRG